MTHRTSDTADGAAVAPGFSRHPIRDLRVSGVKGNHDCGLALLQGRKQPVRQASGIRDHLDVIVSYGARVEEQLRKILAQRGLAADERDHSASELSALFEEPLEVVAGEDIAAKLEGIGVRIAVDALQIASESQLQIEDTQPLTVLRKGVRSFGEAPLGQIASVDHAFGRVDKDQTSEPLAVRDANILWWGWGWSTARFGWASGGGLTILFILLRLLHAFLLRRSWGLLVVRHALISSLRIPSKSIVLRHTASPQPGSIASSPLPLPFPDCP